jgi:hypothetical protein
MIRITAVLLIGLALGSAHAAPIYKCGPDGRTYSQVPCPEGTLLESSDPRTGAQRAEARRAIANERAAAAAAAAAKKAQAASAPQAAAAPKPAASVPAAAARPAQGTLAVKRPASAPK